MKALIQKIQNHPFVQNFLRFFQGAEMDLSSIAVAYYLLVAIFPVFFLLSSLLPYLPIQVEDVLDFLKNALPGEIYDYLGAMVKNILTNPSSGWLGLSIATTLWTFSQSMIILQKAFNKAYGMEDHRDMIVGRLVGIVVGVILQVGLFLLVSVGFFGETIISFVNRFVDLDMKALKAILSWTQPWIFLGFILIIMMLYAFLPNVRIKKVRYVLPGTVFVVGVLAGTTNLVSLYLDQYMDKFESFQLVSYVLLLVVMVWFILIAQLLIVGAVLNASFQALDEPSFTARRGTLAGLIEKLKIFKRKKEKGVKGTQGLLVMDVDSTLIQEEAIDILGELAGVGPQVAAITERAMQGELDFEEALKARVALLKGLPETVFDLVLTKLHFNEGAEKLVEELHARGYKVGLVSGGFHENVDPLAKKLGIDYVKANKLEVKDGQLTGQVEGDIVTKTTKLAMLMAWAKENNLELSQTIAMGDGANDLPMIENAGIGIAYNAKPMVKAIAPYQIDTPDLYQVIEILDKVAQNPHEKDT
ncbi:phosphoserine phosphatase SerB [Streptococcus rupicaprae]|uniref:phosphoserine phosphatase n=1 Tax=Streptococcus rupicaprae TaxID=759619 RepID=A0ABV2FIL9_9STRE